LLAEIVRSIEAQIAPIQQVEERFPICVVWALGRGVDSRPVAPTSGTVYGSLRTSR
jgi:hypothetical protein